jgi:hypothetical protein
LFQGQSVAALNLEMLEDLWIRERELAEEVKTEEGRAQVAASRQLWEVRKVLGVTPEYGSAHLSGDDDLIDQWERDIEAGREPDLDRKG